MKRNLILFGAAAGGVFALAVVALDWLGSLLAGLPRVSFTLFDTLARILPGRFITFFIDSMVAAISRLQVGPTSSVAKQVEQFTAVILFLIIGVVLGGVLALVGMAQKGRYFSQLDGIGSGLGALFGLALVVAAVSTGFQQSDALLAAVWIVGVMSLWGWMTGRTVQLWAAPQAAGVDPRARRQFLWLVGAGTFTLIVSAGGVALLSGRKQIPQTGQSGNTPIPPESPAELANASNTSGPAQSPPLPVLQARFPAVPGTRPELTSNENFYRVDINTLPPHIDASTWVLELGGLVNKPLSLSLDELRARPSTREAITLECISNPIGGDLTSTCTYTGVPLKDLLNEAGLQGSAQEIYIESADGFYESVPMSDAMDERTLLVYEMNDQPLPFSHGYPLRIYIPNHFGMKQPKWITKMTVIDHQGSGYWVDRGWSATAIPPTTSVIDAVDTGSATPPDNLVEVGGIAYAGARGISKVEVQVDGGDWAQAELRQPPLSPLTWVQWRYRWQGASSGMHTFTVRATDGTGQPQVTQRTPPSPDGATGLYSKDEIIP